MEVYVARLVASLPSSSMHKALGSAPAPRKSCGVVQALGGLLLGGRPRKIRSAEASLDYWSFLSKKKAHMDGIGPVRTLF